MNVVKKTSVISIRYIVFMNTCIRGTFFLKKKKDNTTLEVPRILVLEKHQMSMMYHIFFYCLNLIIYPYNA